ncbi:MAG: amidohydrolase [Frankiales bacterium]|nr:amidohydrolase [Frankiales bacterium]
MASTLYRVGSVHGHPGADALLEEGGRIAWLGPAAGAPGADRTIDHRDGWLAPAFVDAHVHVTSTGLALTGLDLTGCRNLTEALRRLEDQVRRVRGGVVLGTGWDETAWPEQRPPTARELDRASAGGVVYLARTDVHSAVASSALLAAVPGVAGLPGFLGDGLVRQQAHHAVRRAALASISGGQRTAAQVAALDRLAAVGIAAAHECAGPDISGEQDLLSLLALEHGVQRVGYWGELGAVDKARELGAVGAAGDLFVDGAIGSHTACLAEPYADADSTGHCYVSVDEVADHVRACTLAGMQAGFHAIGDAAIGIVTDAFDGVAAELGVDRVQQARHRVEHLELVNDEQIAVLASCGVIASVQPAFDARWGGPGGMYATRLGPGRAAGMNPLRALLDAGVVLALGSDSPVTEPDPWGGVRAAVAHRTPGSGITVAEAFYAHTDGGRAAAGADLPLHVGALATFAVWALEGPLVDGLPDLREPLPTCLTTVVGGVAAFG